MVRSTKITSFRQVQMLVKIASKIPEKIGVHDGNGSVADAKSILGLMSLDYSRPVNIVSESESAIMNCLNAVI